MVQTLHRAFAPEQFEKSAFIFQEQGSRTGHELLPKCLRTNFSSTFYERNIGHIFKNNCS